MIGNEKCIGFRVALVELVQIEGEASVDLRFWIIFQFQRRTTNDLLSNSIQLIKKTFFFSHLIQPILKA